MSWCEHFTACLEDTPWVRPSHGGVLTNGLTAISAKGLQCNGGEGRRGDFRKARAS